MLACAALLCLPAVSAGAPLKGNQTKGSSSPTPGSLRQLSGSQACVGNDGANGCQAARAIDGVQSIAASPDGKFFYASSVASNSLTSFSRDTGTGLLTQLAGSDGCVSYFFTSGCGGASALSVPDWVTLSPDGKSLYVTSFESESTSIFARNTTTGVLSQLAGADGCVSQSSSETSCTGARGLDGADHIAISPDGKNAYVTAFRSHGVAVFARDTTTGALTQLSGSDGCVNSTDGSCADGSGLTGATSVAVTPDGKFVYVTARLAQTVTVYARDAATGALTRVPGPDGCVSQVASATCTQANGLPGPNSVVISPDGAHAYVASYVGNALAVFQRNSTSGKLTQLPGNQGCFSGRGSDPACTPARALDGAFVATAAPDGSNVYIAAYDSDAVAVFSRNLGTGALAQLAGTDGCVSNDGTGGDCAKGTAMDGLHEAIITADGKFAYTAANISDAISIFKRSTRKSR